jgi:uncharacterized protein (UPF0212 family)
MKAPSEIMDFLESILGIYFYDIRHKHRSAFILCDSLVELSLKTKILEKSSYEESKKIPEYKFYKVVEKVNELTPIPITLQKDLMRNHDIRNKMQHEYASITIDEQKCADAIINLIILLRKLWGKYSLDDIPPWVDCALRIVKLYSSKGDFKKRKEFRRKMLNDIDWNYIEVDSDSYKLDEKGEESDNDNVTKGYKSILDSYGRSPGKQVLNKNEVKIVVGSEEYWSLVIREYSPKVLRCLDALKIEELH